MVTLDFLIKACLDPVQAALVLAFVVAYRGSEPILITGAAAAVVAETIMALAAPDYVWGELIAPRLVAATIQAAVLVLAVSIVRSAAKSAAGAFGGGRLSSSGGMAAFEAPRSETKVRSSGLPEARSVAPWHMRSYVRRRVRIVMQKSAAVNCESE